MIDYKRDPGPGVETSDVTRTEYVIAMCACTECLSSKIC